MKKGLGHGELIKRSVDDAVDRMDGILSRTGLELDGVFGSRMIGLKKMSSVFKESGDEQSLGVSDDELSWFVSDSAGFELVEAEVEGVLDPELWVILDKKLIPLLKADLKILLYLADGEASLIFVDELALETASLQDT